MPICTFKAFAHHSIQVPIFVHPIIKSMHIYRREVKFVNVAIFSHKTPYKALSKRYFVLEFQDGIKIDMNFVVNPYLDINAFVMEYV